MVSVCNFAFVFYQSFALSPRELRSSIRSPDSPVPAPTAAPPSTPQPDPQPRPPPPSPLLVALLRPTMTDGEQQEALVKRAEDEREGIFRRYELGLDPTNKVDSWENPTFEIYHITDK